MYRIYLYLVWDGVKVARIEVSDHRDRLQFPEILEAGGLHPSTRLELVTDVEFAEA